MSMDSRIFNFFKTFVTLVSACSKFKIVSRNCKEHYKTRKKKWVPIDWQISDMFLLFISVCVVTVASATTLPESTSELSTSTMEMTTMITTTLSSSILTTTTAVPRRSFKDTLKPHQRLPPVEHAGAPRALHVEPILSQYGTVQLNITWKPPKGPRLPTDYSLTVKSIDNGSQTCGSKLCYESGINGTYNWYVVPHTELITSANGGMCEIHPGCAYAINFKANPWDGKTSADLEVTLPDCIEDKCNCEHKYSINPPVIQCQIINDTFINATWTYVNSSSVEHDLAWYNLKIYNKIMSLPIKPLINLHLGHLRGSETGYRLINVTNILKKNSSYVLHLYGVDIHNCHWPEGKFTINMPADEIREPQGMFILQIMIVLVSVVIVSCLVVSLGRCRLCCWLKKLFAPKTIGLHRANSGDIRRQEAWPGEIFNHFFPRQQSDVETPEDSDRCDPYSP